VSSCSTFSYQHAMTFAELDYSVDFTHIRDGFFEKGDVHGCGFELIVELYQFVFDYFLELLPLFLHHFDVDLSVLALVEKINKNGFIFIRIRALLHAAL
jgi:hypothetical protein